MGMSGAGGLDTLQRLSVLRVAEGAAQGQGVLQPDLAFSFRVTSVSLHSQQGGIGAPCKADVFNN